MLSAGKSEQNLNGSQLSINTRLVNVEIKLIPNIYYPAVRLFAPATNHRKQRSRSGYNR